MLLVVDASDIMVEVAVVEDALLVLGGSDPIGWAFPNERRSVDPCPCRHERLVARAVGRQFYRWGLPQARQLKYATRELEPSTPAKNRSSRGAR